MLQNPVSSFIEGISVEHVLLKNDSNIKSTLTYYDIDGINHCQAQKSKSRGLKSNTDMNLEIILNSKV